MMDPIDFRTEAAAPTRFLLTRRRFLAAAATGLATAMFWPRLTLAVTGADARFLFVLLRGGLDGLESVPPYGDPGYAAARGALALSPEAERPAHRLDGVFALHPALDFCARLYAAGQFMPVVAAAPPYWGRSHFQAQDCVENGTATSDGARTGWLNRCVACIPGASGLACAAVMPLTMRGPAQVEAWSPPLPTDVNPILLQRLEPLYAADPRLAAPFARAIARDGAGPAESSAAGTITESGDRSGGSAAAAGATGAAAPAGIAARTGVSVMLGAAGGFMGRTDGPRVAFVEDAGWDTHANEVAVLGRKLAELDAGMAAFRQGVGALWSRTVVVVATEFGRTARVNGTGGTDHGTGGSMFLAGGALRGGRVLGRWPGMGAGELYQGRDVHATTDFRAIFKGVLMEHLGVSAGQLEADVFPDSAAVHPMTGLLSPVDGRTASTPRGAASVIGRA